MRSTCCDVLIYVLMMKKKDIYEKIRGANGSVENSLSTACSAYSYLCAFMINEVRLNTYRITTVCVHINLYVAEARTDRERKSISRHESVYVEDLSRRIWWRAAFFMDLCYAKEELK